LNKRPRVSVQELAESYDRSITTMRRVTRAA
jgi:hypothetical protein